MQLWMHWKELWNNDVLRLEMRRKSYRKSPNAQSQLTLCFLTNNHEKMSRVIIQAWSKHTWQAGHGGTHPCKIYKPLPKQEPINRLSGKHPRTPLTQISSVATHRSDANLSTVIHDRAHYFCVSLVLRGHAILRNLPCVRWGHAAHHGLF